MRKLAIVLAVFTLSTGAVRASDCRCSGTTGCTTSTSCPGGCYAVCGSGGCASGCTENQVASSSVIISAEKVSAAELSEMISAQLGSRFAFVPSKPGDPMTVDIHGMSPSELVKVFGAFGAAGTVQPRAAKKPGADLLFSLRAKNVSHAAVAELIAGLTGGAVVFTPARPEEMVALEMKDLPVRDLQKAFAGYGKVELAAETDTQK